MTIDFYNIKFSPPCRSVELVAQQLKIDLNNKTVDLPKGEHLTPEYLKINPSHTVPTIVDNGFALWESRAIMQYLCNKYAPDSHLYPKEPQARANVDRMLNFDMSLTNSIGNAIMSRVYRGVEPTEADITALKNNLKLLDTLIGSNGYVASNKLTIADISLYATLITLHFNDYDLSEYSNVQQWFDRITDELSYFDEVSDQTKAVFKSLLEGYIKSRQSAK